MSSSNHRGHNFRMSDLPHNPYVGFFHGTFRLASSSQNRIFLPNSSPHVGTFRHSPSHNQGLKEILGDDTSGNTQFVSQIQLSRQNKFADRHIARKALDEIPMSTFTSNNSSANDDAPICPICLEAFVDGDEIRNLKCSHCFHRACVDIWFLGTLTDESVVTSVCPTCRQDAGSSTSSATDDCFPSIPSPDSSGRIPHEIFVRIGQHLFEEGVNGGEGTPVPLVISPIISPQLPQGEPVPVQLLLSSPNRVRSVSLSSVSTTSAEAHNDFQAVESLNDLGISFSAISLSEAQSMNDFSPENAHHLSAE